ncbi:hypothetical protein M9434_004356 [Picochlorum sp. BPE23]|nr:hypothetical protein M9434_004356 [Picochlorum sp. BPE23]
MNKEEIPYEVGIEAIGAEGLDVEEGALVSFMWKRNDMFYLSETGEVWENGIVYWDACSSQTCCFEKIGEDEVKAKYLKLFVQLVPIGPDGLPTDFGTTIASGYINLSDQIMREHTEGEDTEDGILKVPLNPRGCMNLRVTISKVDGDSSLPQLVGEEAQGSDCQTPEAEYVDGHVNGTPMLKKMMPVDQDYSTPTSTMSSSLVNQSSDAGVENGDDASLLRKLKRMTKQCEEARARAFSEASVALQRGIEIDNLQRAKDVLMRRLETAEQQLMTMMKQDLSATLQQSGQVGVTANTEALIHTLAETKVALAEKEFEAMELQGKLRAREAHIEALTMHLDAIREKAESDSIQAMNRLSLQEEHEIEVPTKGEENDCNATHIVHVNASVVH